jgi:hypothetical protein
LKIFSDIFYLEQFADSESSINTNVPSNQVNDDIEQSVETTFVLGISRRFKIFPFLLQKSVRN